MNTSHHLAMAEEAHPSLSRRRLTLNEQLRFFGVANEPRPPERCWIVGGAGARPCHCPSALVV